MLDYENKELAIGMRVELHPGCDLWMQGARFGVVVKLWNHPTTNATLVTVRMDNRAVKGLKVFSNDNVRGI